MSLALILICHTPIKIPSHPIPITPSTASDNSQKIVKLWHCNVRLILSIPDCIPSQLQVVEPSSIMVRSSSVDPDKVQKCIKIKYLNYRLDLAVQN